MGRRVNAPEPRRSSGALVAFAAVVIIGLIGMANNDDDPCKNGCKHVPPSVPTDVGTLKP